MEPWLVSRIFSNIAPGTHYQSINKMKLFWHPSINRPYRLPKAPSTRFCALGYFAVICLHTSTTKVELPEKQAPFLYPFTLSSQPRIWLIRCWIDRFIGELHKQYSITVFISCPYPGRITWDSETKSGVSWMRVGGRELSQFSWCTGIRGILKEWMAYEVGRRR